MKKMKKVHDKEHKRGKQIKIDCECGMSKKAIHVNDQTRMLGKAPKVFRVATSGDGLPKWKKR